MKRMLIFAVAALFVFCKGSSGPDDTGSSIRYVWDLHMPADSLPGWEEDRSRYRIYDNKFLYDLINGGADIFDKNGLVAGIVQLMRYDTLYESVVYVMDFGSEARARAMLGAQKREVGGMTESIAGFDTSTAAANLTLSGNSTYAWFDRFYIELYLSGYADLQKSLADAATFLSVYKRTIRP